VNMYKLSIIKPRAKARGVSRTVVKARSYPDLERRTLKPIFQTQAGVATIEVQKLDEKGQVIPFSYNLTRHYHPDMSYDTPVSFPPHKPKRAVIHHPNTPRKRRGR